MQLSETEAALLLYDWEGLWARDKQLLPEGIWDTWLILAGRGFGKTRTGAETVRVWKEDNPIIHLVGPTASDARDVMVEGESGILNISPPNDRPVYEPSKRRLTWSNGAKAIIFSADEPDRLRGPQCHKAWADELAAWRYDDAWDQLQFGLRLGDNPQCIVTTTPRPTLLVRELAKNPNTHITKGTTYENKANLAAKFFTTVISKYEGTRLGRQELNAEILEDIEGALWKMSLLDRNRVTSLPPFKRVVVAIDPAVTSNKDSDETGIIVAGLGYDNLAYVLDDLSGTYSPNVMAGTAIKAYNEHQADRVVAEVNNGGDMVEAILRNIDKSISYKSVHASRGKVTRAEPVVALYEQGRVKHYGNLAKLETQMTTWNAGEGEKSPDRVDALVWALTDLMLTNQQQKVFTI
ncbi:terminase family protein [Nibribacter koreensis]|uniref:Terminase family protein n=2 Tax=Nibribacter koreensis TaxID=1084519 RepID=A0ABP8FB31_9BACT